ncbi:hypothetical protein [Streptomyces sp. NPDC003077]|uniref:hypothetical protein n=1 Tax=Streptomyces sp. NPDC003077 TaxID=3154443 RepID=UPI0033AB019F
MSTTTPPPTASGDRPGQPEWPGQPGRPQQQQPAQRKKLPSSPVKKPSWDAWTAGKSVGFVLLLIPVALVVFPVLQIVEALYYAVVIIGYLFMSPFWCVRALWRAVRPVREPLHATRRAEARRTIRDTLRGLGCVLVGLVILAVLLIGLVLAVDYFDRG